MPGSLVSPKPRLHKNACDFNGQGNLLLCTRRDNREEALVPQEAKPGESKTSSGSGEGTKALLHGIKHSRCTRINGSNEYKITTVFNDIEIKLSFSAKAGLR